MTVGRIVIVLCLAVILGVPMLVRPDRGAVDENVPAVIIYTPHNEQIRSEFGAAFATWHQESYGTPARVIWNTPGGTSEIRKILRSQYEASLRQTNGPPNSADLFFGGGSYEFIQLRNPVTCTVDGEERSLLITAPVEFEKAWLDEIYGGDNIGGVDLYDKDGYWFGAALSGFGILSNLDALRSAYDLAPDADVLQMQPRQWQDLADPRLSRWLALVNPGQSGSVTTAFDIVLQRAGWTDGWAILRRAGANARYFSASSQKSPLDVSQGEAAAAICIDFYGRFQAQSIAASGDPDRLAYIDPPGMTTIDPDPIAMLNGAPNPELAQRFIEFVLSDDGQALWQFRVDDDHADGRGPERFELRRMPVRQSLYARDFDRFVDQVNPYEQTVPVQYPNRHIRAVLPTMFAAMVIDVHHDLRAAWDAITSHPAYPALPNDAPAPLVRAVDVTDPTLKEMLELFDAMPDVVGLDGANWSLTDATAPSDPTDASSPSIVEVVKYGWWRGQWVDAGLWPDEASPDDVLRRRFAEFFRSRYAQIVELAEESVGP